MMTTTSTTMTARITGTSPLQHRCPGHAEQVDRLNFVGGRGVWSRRLGGTPPVGLIRFGW